ncbi:flavodoxin domain-containing protein [Methanocella arvoryzae]|uniref:Predicted flavodoxin n=1 Tax=Methanocella arvoryzae (strain DSM 22066 / NBRC 105507 / MRE50) TaxID=351160 RepID=Q0W3X6_METAR|nr:flavodoxin domain-containing protein [Methanocella arvoryzae]CAJ36917.1 predicted flavodoxin [Methanocella arvoryzae MRE50]
MTDVLIIYDSNTGNTEKAAAEVLEGVKESGASAVAKKVEDVTEADLRTALAVILGSPCLHDSITGRILYFVEGLMRNVSLSGRPGAAFGSYKWSGGNLSRLEAELKSQGIRLVAPGVNSLRAPNAETARKLRALGQTVGEEALKLKKDL